MARRFLVSGRVQGVGFRWFTMKRARALDLAGWVRNLPDGRVEAMAKGAGEAVAALEAALAKGPTGADVTEIRVGEAGSGDALPRPFVIR